MKLVISDNPTKWVACHHNKRPLSCVARSASRRIYSYWIYLRISRARSEWWASSSNGADHGGVAYDNELYAGVNSCRTGRWSRDARRLLANIIIDCAPYERSSIKMRWRGEPVLDVDGTGQCYDRCRPQTPGQWWPMYAPTSVLKHTGFTRSVNVLSLLTRSGFVSQVDILSI